MDASLAQSAIVWLALGVGLVSVLVCVFSAAVPLDEEAEDAPASQDDSATAFDAERAG
ncbi:MAG: hypothetical protein ACFCUQ_17760 [Kiloniellales bacterium]